MIIGRRKELAALERAYQDNESQFITVYGRRRVGKTYLVREFFKEKDCYFLHVTGRPHGKLRDQLEHFMDAVSKTFFNRAPLKTPKSWKEAFKFLTEHIEKIDKKVVIFLDELPWLATKRSYLLDMIDLYWNNEWSGMNSVILVTCGSSASWILKNIIYNTGGLYNRTTLEIKLSPFKLSETKEYLDYRKVKLNEKQVLPIYMAIGGIPFYLNYVTPGKTAQQNIQHIFFDENAPLAKEYDKLFESLFTYADSYKELIQIIEKKQHGISRNEIAKKAKLSKRGGELSKRLKRLCDAEFINEYLPFGKKRGKYFKVIDEFCLFYLHWITKPLVQPFPPDHWMIESQRPTYYSWAGYAFEAICYKHLFQIIRTLGITSVRQCSPWSYQATSKNEDGAQIDMVIDRGDDAITLCEIKYTEQPFGIDKKYAAIINRKLTVFQKQTKTDKQLFFAMISSNGLKKTMYSEEMVSNTVTLADLFKSYG